jgi:hypothetical protein
VYDAHFGQLRLRHSSDQQVQDVHRDVYRHGDPFRHRRFRGRSRKARLFWRLRKNQEQGTAVVQPAKIITGATLSGLIAIAAGIRLFSPTMPIPQYQLIRSSVTLWQ